MHMIAYISHYSGNDNQVDKTLKDIVATSKENNPKQGITGVLLFDRDRFVQVIEGEQDELYELLHRLKADSRHKSINVFFDDPIDHQEFTDWNMDVFEFEGSSHLNDQLIENFRQIYMETFKPSAVQVVSWVKHMIEEPERFSKVFNG